MRFFSQTLAEKDIKPAIKSENRLDAAIKPEDRRDAAGKSWDGDPSDPKGVDYSKQLVQTFTVGFGEGISEVGREYLKMVRAVQTGTLMLRKKKICLKPLKPLSRILKATVKCKI